MNTIRICIIQTYVKDIIYIPASINFDFSTYQYIIRAIVDIAVYSKQRRIERIVKDDESPIRDDTRDCPVIAQICQGLLVARMSH